jgi:hypothetical protein
VLVSAALQDSAEGAIDHRREAIVQSFGGPLFAGQEPAHDLFVRWSLARAV